LDRWVVPVQTSRLWEVWPKAQHYIEAALAYGDGCSIGQVKEWLANCDAQLLVVGDKLGESGMPVNVTGAMVTQFHPKRQGVTVNIVAFGADKLSETLPYLETIEYVLRASGADFIETRATRGRRGWIRALRKHGYAPSDTDGDGDLILRKAL